MADNVYQKLQSVRDALRGAGVKKTGKGEGRNGNWEFYELDDFWPKAVELFKEQGLFTCTSADKETATLTVLDIAKPKDCIVFSAPFAAANDKSLHPCQNVGWGLSYTYRKLYLNALGLIEKDPVDGGKKTVQKEDVMERFEDTPEETAS